MEQHAAKMDDAHLARARWNDYVEQTAAGSHQALARLYDESSGAVYGLLIRILGNAADADEVCLDVYVQVWLTAPTFDARRGSAACWLFVIARSRALDRLRASAPRRSRELTDTASKDQMLRCCSPGHLPDLLAASEQASARMARAMQGLTATQRDAIELAYFQGMSHAEIAANLRQPLGTIKTRIREGVAKLRKGFAAAVPPEGGIDETP